MISVRTNQKGVSHTVLLLLIVVIAIIAFVAYRVANNETAEPETETTTQTTTDDQITTPAQAEEAEAGVDSADVEGELDTSELDQDIDDLL